MFEVLQPVVYGNQSWNLCVQYDPFGTFKQNTMCPNKGKVTFNVVTVFVWAYDAGALNVRVWVVFQLFAPYTGREEVV